MKLAAYQAPLLDADVAVMIELVARQIRRCEAEGVTVLCCPEAVLGGLADDARNPTDIAINVENGELRALLAPLASESVATIVGFTEAAPAGRVYNSAAIFAKGDVVGIYRKRHPAIRSSVYLPGVQCPVFTVGDLRFGIMICNDSNFPELGTEMVARGATVLFVPSNNALRPEKANIVATTRAVDTACARANGVAVVRADLAGELTDRIAIGSSVIVDASGTIVQAGKPLSEELLVAELS